MFIEQYDTLKRLKKTSMRDVSRKLALDAFSHLYQLTRVTNNELKKPRVQFLYIHHIFKDEEQWLKILLDKLSKDHTFISYSEAVERTLNGRIDKPYISISSDDGLKNNTRAAAIMAGYGISACFFICPPMIGEKDYQKIKSFSEERLHLPAVEFMDWDEVNDLIKTGHEIGAHTMNHVNLAKCSPLELQEEIGKCYEALNKQCGPVKHFAYPYGRYHHFTAEAEKLVFKTGFDSCASAERGCHVMPAGAVMKKEDLFIRRDHIILSWPISHILYFMARNAQKASIVNNASPYHAHSDHNK